MNDDEFLTELKKAVEEFNKRTPAGGFLLTNEQYRALMKWQERVRERERRCADLIEKATPKKPTNVVSYEIQNRFVKHGHCPVCNEFVWIHMKFCWSCGNAIDWSEEE